MKSRRDGADGPHVRQRRFREHKEVSEPHVTRSLGRSGHPRTKVNRVGPSGKDGVTCAHRPAAYSSHSVPAFHPESAPGGWRTRGDLRLRGAQSRAACDRENPEPMSSCRDGAPAQGGAGHTLRGTRRELALPGSGVSPVRGGQGQQKWIGKKRNIF